MYQSTTIIGNVGRDAELRYTPAGIAVTDFSVCVNKVTGKGESKREKATWFKVVVWRDAAEIAAQHVVKGMKIMCVGEMSAEAYIDKNGKAQSALVLTCNLFKFLDSKKDSEDREAAGAASEVAEEEVAF